MTDELRDVLRRCEAALTVWVQKPHEASTTFSRNVISDLQRLLAADEERKYITEATDMLNRLGRRGDPCDRDIQIAAAWLIARDQRRKEAADAR